jgi:hypothetical protein
MADAPTGLNGETVARASVSFFLFLLWMVRDKIPPCMAGIAWAFYKHETL